jgi:hypothetical protein
MLYDEPVEVEVKEMDFKSLPLLQMTTSDTES